jgi:hypothetical protein
MAFTKGIPITLDRTRMMRFTTNALCTMEALTGIKVMSMDMNRLGFTEIRALMFAGLYADDSSMTLEKAGDLLDEYGINKVSDTLTQALTNAMGDDSGNVQAPTASK